MTHTEPPRVQNPVGETQQNDFRERTNSTAAEHAYQESQALTRAPRTKVAAGVELGDTLTAFATVVPTAGMDIDLFNGVAMSEPFRILADDPTRRRAIIPSFTGGQLYIAATPDAFAGMRESFALWSGNPIPPAGVVLLPNTSGLYEFHGTRAVWAILTGDVVSASDIQSPYLCLVIERGTRSQP